MQLFLLFLNANELIHNISIKILKYFFPLNFRFVVKLQKIIRFQCKICICIVVYKKTYTKIRI